MTTEIYVAIGVGLTVVLAFLAIYVTLTRDNGED